MPPSEHEALVRQLNNIADEWCCDMPIISENVRAAADAITALQAERDEWKQTWKDACELAAEDVVEMNAMRRSVETRAKAAEAESSRLRGLLGEVTPIIADELKSMLSNYTTHGDTEEINVPISAYNRIIKLHALLLDTQHSAGSRKSHNQGD